MSTLSIFVPFHCPFHLIFFSASLYFTFFSHQNVICYSIVSTFSLQCPSMFATFILRHKLKPSSNVCMPSVEHSMLIESSVCAKIPSMKHDFELLILRH